MHTYTKTCTHIHSIHGLIRRSLRTHTSIHKHAHKHTQAYTSTHGHKILTFLSDHGSFPVYISQSMMPNPYKSTFSEIGSSRSISGACVAWKIRHEKMHDHITCIYIHTHTYEHAGADTLVRRSFNFLIGYIQAYTGIHVCEEWQYCDAKMQMEGLCAHSTHIYEHILRIFAWHADACIDICVHVHIYICMQTNTLYPAVYVHIRAYIHVHEYLYMHSRT